MKTQDIVGQRFGRLLVIEEAESHFTSSGRKVPRVLCKCDCGMIKTFDAYALTKAQHSTISCGCQRREALGKRVYKHGGSNTRLYHSWHHMKSRCYDARSSNDNTYKNYGGRGIEIAVEWLDFATFRDWALASGYADDLQLDRIDNDGNYEPGNCRWVTMATNLRNKRNTRRLTAFGETKVEADWAKDSRCAVSYATFRYRISTGMDVEKALVTKDRRYSRNRSN